MTDTDDNEKYILQLKTVQSSTFKILIDSLKDLLVEANLVFDEDGLRVSAMDSSKNALVALTIDGNRCEEFMCKRKFYVGVNLMKLNAVIRTITSGDVLTLNVTEDDPNTLVIIMESVEKRMVRTYRLKMLDIDANAWDINSLSQSNEVNMRITMPSSQLQKLCRDMHNLTEGTPLEICCVSNKIFLRCSSDFFSQETVISTDDTTDVNIVNDHDDREIIQGIYSLRYLTLFLKCSVLSQNVELYPRNSFPLIVVFSIANLGDIKLCLSQQDSY